jgi:hypothetical protein
MDDTTLEKRWAVLGRGESLAPAEPLPQHSFYKPLTEAVTEFVHWAQTPEERIYLGFDQLDTQMRGIAPSEMLLINGYSHSGKTMFLLSVLANNRDKPVVYFCPDEPRTLTLVKLACVTNGVHANELEQAIVERDQRAIDLLKNTAVEQFPNLAVFDYLELLQGGGEDVPSKANTIKAFGKRHHVPLVVLHQSSRTSGADGRKQTISSGAYGGEQQASHIIGVRRKKFELQSQIQEIEEKLAKGTATERHLERLDFLRYEERIHENTVTLNLVKCKRPASTLLDDMDYEIEAGTGRLMPLLGVPYDMSIAGRNQVSQETHAVHDQLTFDPVVQDLMFG